MAVLSNLDQSPDQKTLRELRVAIVHYWFVGRAGGERVVEELAELFPGADLFALIAEADQLAPVLRSHRLQTSFLQSIPLVSRFHRHTLLLQPIALEQFDLSGYDLVISSESGPAKGVITGPKTLHICYCHSPMRYLWDMYSAYADSMAFPVRFIFRMVSHWMRVWDVISANRVDCFIANSRFVASRIFKYYRRDAEVIHPPVNVSGVEIAQGAGQYYLCAGRLVDYKRVDLAIDACRQLGRTLKVAGEGPLLKSLRMRGADGIECLGRVSDTELASLMLNCRALLFPGEEDFGLVPVEVMARGRPVIAFASGGALETVNGLRPGQEFHDDCTGVLFEHQTPADLVRAIERFESIEDRFIPHRLNEHALQFDSAVFRAKMLAFTSQCLASFRAGDRGGGPRNAIRTRAES